MQIDPLLSLCTKLKSKWIKDLHIKTRYTESNRRESGEKSQTHGHRGKNIPELWNLQRLMLLLTSTIYKWDHIKLQIFCKAKDTVNRTKQQPTVWENIFTYPISNGGLISNMHKKLKKLDSIDVRFF
jgi:hypothetical protein